MEAASRGASEAGGTVVGHPSRHRPLARQPHVRRDRRDRASAMPATSPSWRPATSWSRSAASGERSRRSGSPASLGRPVVLLGGWRLEHAMGLPSEDRYAQTPPRRSSSPSGWPSAVSWTDVRACGPRATEHLGGAEEEVVSGKAAGTRGHDCPSHRCSGALPRPAWERRRRQRSDHRAPMPRPRRAARRAAARVRARADRLRCRVGRGDHRSGTLVRFQTATGPQRARAPCVREPLGRRHQPRQPGAAAHADPPHGRAAARRAGQLPGAHHRR